MVSTDMRGKTVLISGATGGIGKVTALELAKMGAQVILVGRSAARAQAAIDDIKAAYPAAQTDSLIADLSIMDEVRRLAGEFQSKYSRLDVLVNNAGALYSSYQETDDGYELTFALNHLNYFLLTELLLPTLKASTPARVINVSSDAHRGAKLDFNNLQHKHEPFYRILMAYGQSKLMNVLFTYELSRRLAGTGITANAMHPGSVATGWGHNNRGLVDLALRAVHLFSLTPEQGADTIIYLASSPDVEGVTGKYFYQRKAVISSPETYNEADACRLWEISEQLTGLEPTKATA